MAGLASDESCYLVQWLERFTVENVRTFALREDVDITLQFGDWKDRTSVTKWMSLFYSSTAIKGNAF
jgi:hypothetical protein